MREIKFRAWDIEMKVMLDWKDIEEQWRDEGYHPAILSGDHYVPMQFTGLHDKNGKEIWEGDIVRHHMFHPTRIKDLHNFYDICRDIKRYDWKPESLEVIGNVYENPELLEVYTTKG